MNRLIGIATVAACAVLLLVSVVQLGGTADKGEETDGEP